MLDLLLFLQVFLFLLLLFHRLLLLLLLYSLPVDLRSLLGHLHLRMTHQLEQQGLASIGVDSELLGEFDSGGVISEVAFVGEDTGGVVELIELEVLENGIEHEDTWLALVELGDLALGLVLVLLVVHDVVHIRPDLGPQRRQDALGLQRLHHQSLEFVDLLHDYILLLEQGI